MYEASVSVTAFLAKRQSVPLPSRIRENRFNASPCKIRTIFPRQSRSSSERKERKREKKKKYNNYVDEQPRTLYRLLILLGLNCYYTLKDGITVLFTFDRARIND